jgi:hypothetical protein
MNSDFKNIIHQLFLMVLVIGITVCVNAAYAWSEDPDSPTLLNTDTFLGDRVIRIQALSINDGQAIVAWNTRLSHGSRLLTPSGISEWRDADDIIGRSLPLEWESNDSAFLLSGSTYRRLTVATDSIVVSDAVQVDANIADFGGISMIPDRQGTAIASWVGLPLSDPLTSKAVFISKFDSNGIKAWDVGSIQLLQASIYNSLVIEPYLVSDNLGGAYIVDHWNYSGTTRIERIDTDGNFPWANAISISGYLEAISEDNSTGMFVAWRENVSDTEYNLYAQHINAEGGQLWGDQGVLVATTDLAFRSASNQQVLRNVTIIKDASDGIYLTWGAFDNDGLERINVAYVDNSGAVAWSKPIALARIPGVEPDCTERVCVIPRYDQRNPSATLSTNGSLIVSYEENFTVKAQKINVSGELLWGEYGKTISNRKPNAVVNEYLGIVDNQSDGAIVVWGEQKLTSDYIDPPEQDEGKILIQNIYSDGTRSSSKVPANVSPAENALDIELNIVLTASDFEDSAGNYHVASRWRMFLRDEITYDSEEITDLTQHQLPSGRLLPNTNYQWSVSYKNSLGEWTEWSAKTAFVTKPAEENIEPDLPPVSNNNPPGSNSPSPSGGGGSFGIFFFSIILLQVMFRKYLAPYFMRTMKISSPINHPGSISQSKPGQPIR